jgi:RimJ/RimL family protein N-acetyltransferase
MRPPAEELVRDGVRLRRWRLKDADIAYAAVAESLEHLSPWMVWAQPGYGPSDVAAFLAQCEREWRIGEAYHYAIVAPDGAVVGSIGLMALAVDQGTRAPRVSAPEGIGAEGSVSAPEGIGAEGSVSAPEGIGAEGTTPGGLEIGYWIHPRYTGQGIVTRATAALAGEAFRVGAAWLEIKHDVANVRSGGIPKRLGFTRVGERPTDEPISSAARTGIDLVWRLARADAGDLGPSAGGPMSASG